MRSAESRARSPVLAWLALAAGLGVALALLLAGQAIAGQLDIDSLGVAISLFYLLLFGPLIVLPLVLGAIARRKVLRGGEHRWRWTVLGLATGFGGLSVTVAYAWLHGTLTPGEVARATTGYLALGLALTMLQVVAEEVMFRGWLFPAVAERVGIAGGIGLSAAAFSAFHLIGGAKAPLSLFNLVLGGVWFALLAWRSGGLLAPIAAHFGWNIAEDLGLGLVPNPGVGELGALINYDLRGSALWGGSAEGLNASLAMTVVLVALIVPLAWPRRPSVAAPG
ncbi:MAG: CPBP family intramembrane glutamic endopeptidase [Novosphingobium sp.]